MEKRVGVLLIGRHETLLDSLAARIRTDSRLAVLGVARTPKESAKVVTKGPVDLVLIDTDADGNSHFEAARAIKAVRPEIHILFLSGVLRDAVIEQALAVGARGFVLKHDPPGTILTAIHEVLEGGCCFPENVRSRLVVNATGVSLASQPRRTRSGKIAVNDAGTGTASSWEPVLAPGPRV